MTPAGARPETCGVTKNMAHIRQTRPESGLGFPNGVFTYPSVSRQLRRDRVCESPGGSDALIESSGRAGEGGEAGASKVVVEVEAHNPTGGEAGAPKAGVEVHMVEG